MKSQYSATPEQTRSSAFLLDASRHLFLVSGIIYFLVALTPTAKASIQYWDADGGGSSTLGGSGIWDTSSLLWRLGTTTGSLGAYTNTAGTGTAEFFGSPGVITIASGTTINANAIIFGGSGFTITGSDAGSVLNLDGTNPTVYVGYGHTDTISASIAGTAGIIKAQDYGSSSLILSGSNTYTGTTIIGGGSLILDMNAGGAMNSATALTFGNGWGTGSFVVRGKDGTASTLSMGNFTVSMQSTFAKIVLASGSGAGSSINLTLGNTWTRSGGASTVNIDLSGGNCTLTSSPTLQNGIVGTSSAGSGGWVTVTDAVGTGFATVDAAGHVVRYTGATTLPSTGFSASINYVTKATDAGYTNVDGMPTLTLSSGAKANTLQLDTSAGVGAIVLTGTLALANRGILVTGNNDYAIENGQLNTSGLEVIIHHYGTGTLTVSSAISGSAGGKFTKDGPGLVVLTGISSYGQITTISGGTLRANDGVNIPSAALLAITNGIFETGANITRSLGNAAATNSVYVAGDESGFSAFGGHVDVALGGTAAPVAVQYNDLFNPTIFVLNASTANSTINFMNSLNLSGFDRRINVDATGKGTEATISGKIVNSGSSAGIVKGGAGTLILSNMNTYDGITTVTNGTLEFNSTASGSAAQALGKNDTVKLGVSGSNNVATLKYTGVSGTLDKNIYALGSGLNIIENSGGGLLTLSGSLVKNSTVLVLTGGSYGINVTGVISGAGANSDLYVTNGTTTLSSANSYNGPTWVYGGGILVNGVNNALPTNTSLILGGTSGGTDNSSNTFDLHGYNQTVASLTGTGIGAQTITNNGAGTSNLTVSGGGIYGGVIVNGSGTTSLTVIGGNLALGGNNTYTGATSITGGTLSVNGSLAAGSTVSVNSVLAGSGTIGGVVTNSGTISGGLTFNNDVIVNSGATAAAAAFNGNITDNGSITSDVTVRSGKTLSGSGVAGAVNVQSATINGSGLSIGAAIFDGQSTISGTTTATSVTINSGTTSAIGVTTSSGNLSVSAGSTLKNTGSFSANIVNVANTATLTNNGTLNGTVNVSGVLTGTGTINGALTIKTDGELAPGNSPGTTTVAGSLTVETGAKVSIQIEGITKAGSDYDQIVVTGASSLLTLNTGSILNLTIPDGVFTSGSLTLIENQSDSAIVGTFNSVVVGGSTYDVSTTNKFTYNGKEYELLYNVNADNGSTPNDFELVVVPEPSTWAMVLGGIGTLIGIQRMRRSTGA